MGKEDLGKKNRKKILGKKQFRKRIDTLVTKASQLHTLCDVSVLLVCRGTNGELDTWPPLNCSQFENTKSRYYQEINGNIHQPQKEMKRKKPKTSNSKSDWEEYTNLLEKELGLTPTGKKNTSAATVSATLSDYQFWSENNTHQIDTMPLAASNIQEEANLCGFNSISNQVEANLPLLNQGEAANNVQETEVDDLSKLCGIKPPSMMISKDTINMAWLNPAINQYQYQPAINQYQYQDDTSILAPLPEALMIPSPNDQFYYPSDYGMPYRNCEFYNPSMCCT